MSDLKALVRMEKKYQKFKTSSKMVNKYVMELENSREEVKENNVNLEKARERPRKDSM